MVTVFEDQAVLLGSLKCMRTKQKKLELYSDFFQLLVAEKMFLDLDSGPRGPAAVTSTFAAQGHHCGSNRDF